MLQCERAVPGPRELRPDAGGWVLDLPRPPLQRLEYRFAVARRDAVEVLLDPANPVTVRTAFGDRSVMEMPGYAPPWWLSAPAVPGRLEPHTLAGETSHEVPVTVWSPVDLPADEPAPLLLVHDGPEYDQLARDHDLQRGARRRGSAPAAPGRARAPRDPRRLVLRVAAVPADHRARRPRRPRGAVRRARTGRRRRGEPGRPHRPPPRTAGGAAGGRRLSPSRGRSSRCATTTPRAATATSGGSRAWSSPCSTPGAPSIPLTVGMSCGSLEENAANNRDMAAALRRAGHDVTLREVPDLHNYTAWRDALDPGLTDVLRGVWSAVVASS